MFLFDFIAKGSELVTEVPVASEPSSTPPPAVVGSEVDKEVVTYEVIRTVKTINSTTGEVVGASSVSQDFDAIDERTEREDLKEELAKIGWTPRGRPDNTSAPSSPEKAEKKKPAKPKSKLKTKTKPATTQPQRSSSRSPSPSPTPKRK